MVTNRLNTVAVDLNTVSGRLQLHDNFWSELVTGEKGFVPQVSQDTRGLFSSDVKRRIPADRDLRKLR